MYKVNFLITPCCRLKRCGNVSCGATLDPNSRVSTYISGDGSPAPPAPPSPAPPVPDIEDYHYPPEELVEQSTIVVPTVVSVGIGWALLKSQGGSQNVNVSVGEQIDNFMLLSTISSLPHTGLAAAVLERIFTRWGVVIFITTAGEAARLRQGTGSAMNLSMPNYKGLSGGGGNSTCGDNDYYSRVAANASDWIAGRIVEDASDGEASFLGAVRQRNELFRVLHCA